MILILALTTHIVLTLLVLAWLHLGEEVGVNILTLPLTIHIVFNSIGVATLRKRGWLFRFDH